MLKPVKKKAKAAPKVTKPVADVSKHAPELPLTVKQQLFVLEYLVDKNATQAAIRAGYSKRTANKIGPSLLVKVGIKEAIDAELEKQKTRISFTADQVLEELARIGLADMKDFIEIDEGGAIRALPLDTLAEGNKQNHQKGQGKTGHQVNSRR